MQCIRSNYSVSKDKASADDMESYGISLAFCWICVYVSFKWLGMTKTCTKLWVGVGEGSVCVEGWGRRGWVAERCRVASRGS